ncbi:MAG: hypothetical protein HYV29_05265 [Ignavibacteriales bacterium]|nr:hypothetical protein [Ignavibacteriales bacterium]
MKRNIVLAAIVALVYGSAIAQESGMGKQNQDPAQMQMQELTCRTAADIGKDPQSVEKKAAEYTKANAASLGAVNGFSLLVGSEWFKLDAAGNGRAQAVVRNSKKESGILVIVKGRRYGDTIAVTSIEEVVAKSDKPQYK